jgi:hypothetical protein
VRVHVRAQSLDVKEGTPLSEEDEEGLFGAEEAYLTKADMVKAMVAERKRAQKAAKRQGKLDAEAAVRGHSAALRARHAQLPTHCSHRC